MREDGRECGGDGTLVAIQRMIPHLPAPEPATVAALIDRVPGDQVEFSQLAPLLGVRVMVTVADGPRQVQNGPWRWVGTVGGASQLDANGRNTGAGDGTISFTSGATARWTRHDVLTVEVLP